MVDIPSSTDICRVCRAEGADDNPLFYPCKCSGTIRFVHEDCLVQWLKVSKRKKCELCSYPFKFSPVFKTNMPKRLPADVLLSGLIRRCKRFSLECLHTVLVVFVWTAVLPSVCASFFHLFFWNATWYNVLTYIFIPGLSPTFIYDCVLGYLVMFGTMVLLFTILYLKDEIINHGWNPNWLILPNANNNFEENENVDAQVQAGEVVGNINADNNDNDNNNNNPSDEEDNANEAVVDDTDDENPDAGAQNDNPPAAAQAVQAPQNNDNIPANLIQMNDDAAVQHILGLDGTYHFIEYGFWFAVLCLCFLFLCLYTPWRLGNNINVTCRSVSSAAKAMLRNTEFIGYNLTQFNAVQFGVNFMSLVRSRSELNTKSFRVDWYSVPVLKRVESSDPTIMYVINTFIGYTFIALIFRLAYMVFEPGSLLTIGVLKAMKIGFGLTERKTKLLLSNARFFVGVSHVIVKLVILFIIEAAIYPTLFGYWINFSSVELLNSTITERVESFKASPCTNIFFHWLGGIVFITYFVWMMLVARQELRPGVLWFVRSYSDVNPFQHLAKYPISKCIRTLSFVLLRGFIIVSVCFWIPSKILVHWMPGGLFPLRGGAISPSLPRGETEFFVELFIQFCVLHYLAPSIFNEINFKRKIAYCVRLWAYYVSRLLGLEAYLLGEEKLNNIRNEFNRTDEEEDGAPQAGQNMANFQDNHNAIDNLFMTPAPRFEAYERPRYFAVRLIAMLAILVITAVSVMTCSVFFPTLIGRVCLKFIIYGRTNVELIPDLFSIWIGVFCIMVLFKFKRNLRQFAVARNFIQPNIIWTEVRHKILRIVKALIAIGLILIWLPMLFGSAIEMTFYYPYMVVIQNQTPLLLSYRCFCYGLMLGKIFVTTIILVAPENDAWRQRFEMVLQNGFQNLDLSYIFHNIVWPISMGLLTYLTVPYVIVKCLIVLEYKYLRTADHVNIVNVAYLQSSSHISTFFAVLSVAMVSHVASTVSFVEDEIRKENYLIKLELVNFGDRKKKDAKEE